MLGRARPAAPTPRLLVAVPAALLALALGGCDAAPPAPRETVVLSPGQVVLTETVGTEVSDNGCPGWTAPSPAPQATSFSDDASTSVHVTVAEEPLAVVLLVCLGATDVVGTVDEIVAVRRAADGPTDLPLVADPVTVLSAYGAAVRTEQAAGSSRLTEWLTEQDGHTFAVGFLRPEGDDTHVATVEAMLAGWQWR